ncbi:hypothetical protein [Malaciobacter marinus]|uniref:Uncharacterized protein n=1 Tax=Malaciobacter marinus TaxID=505249 RepID=A0A347TP69_9BACT|nr:MULTISPECIES: hypothetical protein [Malaciobacter]AXX88397.1 hypothetical protein AMRN_2699 [Malaciobacter marinus]PHO16662.1 hypothetical protein CPH92_00580 [Malaciobacter marinus]RYA24649.1 hypothetical protein CRU96_01975 [Malaciobacter halophilus]
MIFIFFFSFIVVLLVGLNIYDNMNLNKLKEYIKKQDCQMYIYSKGSYKAICQNKVLVLKNSFEIDLDKNKVEILYKNIKETKIEQNSIFINDTKLDFREKNSLEKFYNLLQDKLNNE